MILNQKHPLPKKVRGGGSPYPLVPPPPSDQTPWFYLARIQPPSRKVASGGSLRGGLHPPQGRFGPPKGQDAAQAVTEAAEAVPHLLLHLRGEEVPLRVQSSQLGEDLLEVGRRSHGMLQQTNTGRYMDVYTSIRQYKSAASLAESL